MILQDAGTTTNYATNIVITGWSSNATNPPPFSSTTSQFVFVDLPTTSIVIPPRRDRDTRSRPRLNHPVARYQATLRP